MHSGEKKHHPKMEWRVYPSWGVGAGPGGDVSFGKKPHHLGKYRLCWSVYPAEPVPGSRRDPAAAGASLGRFRQIKTLREGKCEVVTGLSGKLG